MKLTDWFVNRFGTDKMLHFLVGALIVSMLSYFGWLGIIGATILVFVLSIIKEKYLDTFFDKGDIKSAMLGCMLSVLVYVLFTLLF